MRASHRPVASWSITLAVRDLPRAVRWYQHVFGFKLVAERPGLTGVPVETRLRRSAEIDLALLLGLLPHERGLSRPGSGVTLTIGTEEYLEHLVDRALTRGGSLIEGPAERHWQRQDVVIADPDGYQWMVLRRA